MKHNSFSLRVLTASLVCVFAVSATDAFASGAGSTPDNPGSGYAPPTNLSLYGTQWLLVAVHRGKSVANMRLVRQVMRFNPKPGPINWSLTDEGVASASYGIAARAACNLVAGNVETRKNSFLVRTLVGTRRACRDLAYEDLFLSVLNQAVSYKVIDTHLYIYSRDAILVFETLARGPIGL